MKKKLLVTLMVAVAAVSLMGCHVTTTKTYTETTTDANGNTTTTTTTTTNGNTTTETTETTAEEAAEPEATVATIAFENETDFDFAELYFASANSDNWGEDILGEDAPLAVGEVITYNERFTYSADNTVWDIKAVDADGSNIEFAGADMLAAADPTNIYLLFTVNEEDQTYTVTIQ